MKELQDDLENSSEGITEETLLTLEKESKTDENNGDVEMSKSDLQSPEDNSQFLTSTQSSLTTNNIPVSKQNEENRVKTSTEKAELASDSSTFTNLLELDSQIGLTDKKPDDKNENTNLSTSDLVQKIGESLPPLETSGNSEKNDKIEEAENDSINQSNKKFETGQKIKITTLKSTITDASDDKNESQDIKNSFSQNFNLTTLGTFKSEDPKSSQQPEVDSVPLSVTGEQIFTILEAEEFTTEMSRVISRNDTVSSDVNFTTEKEQSSVSISVENTSEIIGGGFLPTNKVDIDESSKDSNKPIENFSGPLGQEIFSTTSESILADETLSEVTNQTQSTETISSETQPDFSEKEKDKQNETATSLEGSVNTSEQEGDSSRAPLTTENVLTGLIEGTSELTTSRNIGAVETNSFQTVDTQESNSSNPSDQELSLTTVSSLSNVNDVETRKPSKGKESESVDSKLPEQTSELNILVENESSSSDATTKLGIEITTASTSELLNSSTAKPLPVIEKFETTSQETLLRTTQTVFTTAPSFEVKTTAVEQTVSSTQTVFTSTPSFEVKTTADEQTISTTTSSSIKQDNQFQNVPLIIPSKNEEENNFDNGNRKEDQNESNQSFSTEKPSLIGDTKNEDQNVNTTYDEQVFSTSTTVATQENVLLSVSVTDPANDEPEKIFNIENKQNDSILQVSTESQAEISPEKDNNLEQNIEDLINEKFVTTTAPSQQENQSQIAPLPVEIDQKDGENKNNQTETIVPVVSNINDENDFDSQSKKKDEENQQRDTIDSVVSVNDNQNIISLEDPTLVEINKKSDVNIKTSTDEQISTTALPPSKQEIQIQNVPLIIIPSKNDTENNFDVNPNDDKHSEKIDSDLSNRDQLTEISTEDSDIVENPDSLGSNVDIGVTESSKIISNTPASDLQEDINSEASKTALSNIENISSNDSEVTIKEAITTISPIDIIQNAPPLSIDSENAAPISVIDENNKLSNSSVLSIADNDNLDSSVRENENDDKISTITKTDISDEILEDFEATTNSANLTESIDVFNQKNADNQESDSSSSEELNTEDESSLVNKESEKESNVGLTTTVLLKDSVTPSASVDTPTTTATTLTSATSTESTTTTASEGFLSSGLFERVRDILLTLAAGLMTQAISFPVVPSRRGDADPGTRFPIIRDPSIRKKIQEENFSFQGNTLNFTIPIGPSEFNNLRDETLRRNLTNFATDTFREGNIVHDVGIIVDENESDGRIIITALRDGQESEDLLSVTSNTFEPSFSEGSANQNSPIVSTGRPFSSVQVSTEKSSENVEWLNENDGQEVPPEVDYEINEEVDPVKRVNDQEPVRQTVGVQQTPTSEQTPAFTSGSPPVNGATTILTSIPIQNEIATSRSTTANGQLSEVKFELGDAITRPTPVATTRTSVPSGSVPSDQVPSGFATSGSATTSKSSSDSAISSEETLVSTESSQSGLRTTQRTSDVTSGSTLTSLASERSRINNKFFNPALPFPAQTTTNDENEGGLKGDDEEDREFDENNVDNAPPLPVLNDEEFFGAVSSDDDDRFFDSRINVLGGSSANIVQATVVEDLNFARSVRDSSIGIATISSITVGVIALLGFGLLIFLALARRRRMRRQGTSSMGSPMVTPTQSRTTFSGSPVMGDTPSLSDTYLHDPINTSSSAGSSLDPVLPIDGHGTIVTSYDDYMSLPENARSNIFSSLAGSGSGGSAAGPSPPPPPLLPPISESVHRTRDLPESSDFLFSRSPPPYNPYPV